MINRIPFLPDPLFSLATDIATIWIHGQRAVRLTLGLAAMLSGRNAIVLSVLDIDRPAIFLVSQPR